MSALRLVPRPPSPRQIRSMRKRPPPPISNSSRLSSSTTKTSNSASPGCSRSLLRDVSQLNKRLSDLAVRHPGAARIVVDRNTKLLNAAFQRRHEKADLRPRPPTEPWLALVNALQTLALTDPARAKACIGVTIVALTRMLAGADLVVDDPAEQQGGA